jgi:deoxyadenosine/deoxycytidine kinase
MLNHHRYIVVEGPIGVGKTTLVKKLAQTFGSGLMLEKVDDNPFIAQFYKNPARYALSTQLSFLLQRAEQVQNFRQIDLFQNEHIADFLIDKDPLFAELTLTPDELKLYQDIYQRLTIDAPRPDLVIYLQAPVEVLQSSIAIRNRSYEKPITLDYLSKLSNAYTQFFHNYDEKTLLTVNTQSIDLINNDADYDALIDEINQVQSGRHFYNQSSFPF